jgi:hypothetical protein
VIDGDVARAALDQDRYGHRYDVALRMIRRGGIWRIELAPRDLLSARPSGSDAERARRENDVIAHLDRYRTPGSVLEVLDPVRAGEPKVNRNETVRQANQQIDEARKRLATQPASNPREKFDQEMQVTLLKLTAALVAGDAPAAAKFYLADGDDDQSYALAREQRALAVHRLSEAADKEIDSGAERIIHEMQLIDVADDLYGLAMIEWTVQGDKAVGKNPQGIGDESFWVPKLRRVGGVWKIDVTDEVNGNPKQAVQRAKEETRLIEQLTDEVNKLKFSNLEQLKAALIKSGVKGPAKPM